jgi:5-methylcytosine-specific restriction endonuclease McrA
MTLHNQLNLKDKKFNRLLAIKPVNKTRYGAWRWRFKCDCGKECISVGYQVKSGLIRSCGCLRRSKDVQKSGVKIFFQDYRYGAQSRNYSFKLSLKEFTKIVNQDCYYCGLKPEQRYRKFKFIANGIDRLNNKKGYTKTNCVSCCSICNKAKSTMELSDFTEWIERLRGINNRQGC